MEKYQNIKSIGSGSFASVVKAINKNTNEVVAIKKMNQKFLSWDQCLQLREIQALKKLKHDNLMKLKEVIKVEETLYLVFEYCDENLYQYYQNIKDKGQTMSEDQIRDIIYQSLLGLSFMHKHGFFHRDMKPENILIQTANKHNIIKIGDLGLAREIRSRPPYTEYVSTRWYRAPEILLHSTNYNSPVDIFAMGCIMAELFVGTPLFTGSSEIDQLNKICQVLGTPSQQNWTEGYRLASQTGYNFPQYSVVNWNQIIPNASENAINLIQEMIRFDPQKRPSAQQLLQHSFFQQSVEKSLSNGFKQKDKQKDNISFEDSSFMQDNSILKEIDHVLLNTQKSNKQKEKEKEKKKEKETERETEREIEIEKEREKQSKFDNEHDKTQTIENLLNDLGLGDDSLVAKQVGNNNNIKSGNVGDNQFKSQSYQSNLKLSYSNNNLNLQKNKDILQNNMTSPYNMKNKSKVFQNNIFNNDSCLNVFNKDGLMKSKYLKEQYGNRDFNKDEEDEIENLIHGHKKY